MCQDLIQLFIADGSLQQLSVVFVFGVQMFTVLWSTLFNSFCFTLHFFFVLFPYSFQEIN